MFGVYSGDVMGPSVEGLDSLVKMPFGCGEQNMITFTPNIFVRSYLQRIGELIPELCKKTKDYMIKGNVSHYILVLNRYWTQILMWGLVEWIISLTF